MKISFDINFSEILGLVKRSLSIIGKRSVDDKGNSLFNRITLSSVEETIIEDYVREAILVIVVNIREFITSETDGKDSFTFTAEFPDDISGIQTSLTLGMKTYCANYALYSWLSIVVPNLAQKYMDDANNFSNYIVMHSFTHNKPAVTAKPLA